MTMLIFTCFAGIVINSFYEYKEEEELATDDLTRELGHVPERER